jgi:hypothetical protein
MPGYSDPSDQSWEEITRGSDIAYVATFTLIHLLKLYD